MAKIKIGKIPVYKGEYDNSITYNRLNQVTYLGTTFLSLVDDNLGHPPAEKSEDGGEILYINTNYWDIIAKGIDTTEERTATNNSMGYKILKKNKSFIEQVTEENTIYEIRYDFDLGGGTTYEESVSIPANCVLQFEGGSISNGALKGKATGIVNDANVKIFGTDVAFWDSWKTTECTPEWFGAKGDGNIDDTAAVKAAILNYKVYNSPNWPNSVSHASVKFKNQAKYKITETITIPGYFAKQKYYSDGTAVLQFTNTGDGIVLHQDDTNWDYIYFANLVIAGPDDNKQYTHISERVSQGAGFNIERAYYCRYYNMQFVGFKYGIKCTTGIENLFHDCRFYYNKYGIYIKGVGAFSYATFDNCMIRENYCCAYYTEGIAAFNSLTKCDIESNSPYHDDDIVTTPSGELVVNGELQINAVGLYINDNGVSVRDCYFENQTTAGIYINANSGGTVFDTVNFNENNYHSNVQRGVSVHFHGSINHVSFINCFNTCSIPRGYDIERDSSNTDLSTVSFINCTGIQIHPDIIKSNNKPLFINTRRTGNGDGNEPNTVRLYRNDLYTNIISFDDITTKPYFDESTGTLYTNGFNNIIYTGNNKNITIKSIVGLDRGDIVTISMTGNEEDYQKNFITIVGNNVRGGGIVLKSGNSSIVELRGANDMISFCKMSSGEIVEIFRNIKRTNKCLYKIAVEPDHRIIYFRIQDSSFDVTMNYVGKNIKCGTVVGSVIKQFGNILKVQFADDLSNYPLINAANDYKLVVDGKDLDVFNYFTFSYEESINIYRTSANELELGLLEDTDVIGINSSGRVTFITPPLNNNTRSLKLIALTDFTIGGAVNVYLSNILIPDRDIIKLVTNDSITLVWDTNKWKVISISSRSLSLKYAELPSWNEVKKGDTYFNSNADIPHTAFWDGNNWLNADGSKHSVKYSGTFAQKPAGTDIYIGFRYFCTDKQTTEGAINGIDIIYKGNNVWVDALGRIIS